MTIPGKRSSTARNGAGFTLLEILLAMAIIALMAAVLIGGAGRLLSDRPVTVNEVFFKAVMEARKSALTHERDVQLLYVGDDRDKGKLFVVIDGEQRKDFPIPPQTITNDFQVDFLSAQKGGAMIVVGGTVMESQPIKSVTFYSDGTCQPFRMQVVRNGASGITSIDPWTCAPVLTPPDPNAPRT
jgi:prepilin-type N-terminal cleavage/methylation domain-containing protein